VPSIDLTWIAVEVRLVLVQVNRVSKGLILDVETVEVNRHVGADQQLGDLHDDRVTTNLAHRRRQLAVV
jgi:hypothetical protein